MERYRIFCQKLVRERHYTASALLWTSGADSYGGVSKEASLDSFLASFFGYLRGLADEFGR